MAYQISGKVALVTGANRGIGKAIVESFLERGASKVYAAVRSIDSAADLVAKYGDKVVPVEVDLHRPETVSAAAALATDVGIVVNNAGILKLAGPLSDEVFATFSDEINVNVLGLLRVAQAFAPILKANGGGALVQLNSVASVKSFVDFSSYCASKAASYSFTQSLRDALAGQGTQVLSVHPGPIATDMAASVGFEEMADPVTIVSDGIVDALEAGDFHLFPDTMAKQVFEAYAGFAAGVVEANRMEG